MKKIGAPLLGLAKYIYYLPNLEKKKKKKNKNEKGFSNSLVNRKR